MMQEADLQELAELVSRETPILSLYLNVDPHRRSTEEHKLYLRRLLAQAAQQGASRTDIERAERFFDHEYDRQGRGVACFSCQDQKFWRDHALLVPVEDFVFVGSRPYLTPLSDAWDAYGRFGVIMVDREGARVLVYHLGALEDSAGTLGTEVRRHKQGGWAAQKLQRYEDQEAKQNLKDAAEWADAYLREHRATRVVLSGSEDNLAQFRDLLPRDLQDKVVGHISLDMTASPAQVWDRAFDVTLAAQRQAEADLLNQVVTVAHKGGAGALGLEDTLAAMQQGRVYQLLVDREFHQPGYQCSVCQAVVTQELPSCPYCGGTLMAIADVVNLAVQKAVDAGLKVSVLDHNPQTVGIGGIAAVLRY
jgi:peptide subunit release factor 1 (eRF1)